MLEMFFSVLHNLTTLLFGIFLSAAFVGIILDKRNCLRIGSFTLVVSVLYLTVYALFGTEATTRIYPFMIHIPLIIFLSLAFKKPTMLTTLSVMTAYLSCQISKWLGLLALDLSDQMYIYYAFRILVTILVFIILIHFVTDASAQLMKKPTKALVIIAIMPITYYLFDYFSVVYTDLLYSGRGVVVEFLGFLLSIAYLLFLLVYFKQYEEKAEAEQIGRMLEMQQKHSQKELENIRNSEHQIALLRHDMRHFLLNISGYIDNDENEKAREYIGEILTEIEGTSIHKYCKNELVNMILSSYASRFEGYGVEFDYNIQIPDQLPLSDVDLTSLLSNGLENALNAVNSVSPEKRRIHLDMKTLEEKTFISLKNTYKEEPHFLEGLPQSSKAGHGLGTQSILYSTQKLSGNCQFLTKDGWFILRIVL